MRKIYNVLGADYITKFKTTVKDKDDPTKENEILLGLCIEELGELHIKKGLAKELRREVVIHELVHAVIRELEERSLTPTLGERHEEKLVDAIAKTLVYNKLIKGC
jgi:Zn-dependent peptidase ImmA (M78 family)